MTANEILEESGVPKSQRKKVIDKIAAAIILQDFMSSMENKGSRKGEGAVNE